MDSHMFPQARHTLTGHWAQRAFEPANIHFMTQGSDKLKQGYINNETASHFFPNMTWLCPFRCSLSCLRLTNVLLQMWHSLHDSCSVACRARNLGRRNTCMHTEQLRSVWSFLCNSMCLQQTSATHCLVSSLCMILKTSSIAAICWLQDTVPWSSHYFISKCWEISPKPATVSRKQTCNAHTFTCLVAPLPVTISGTTAALPRAHSIRERSVEFATAVQYIYRTSFTHYSSLLSRKIPMQELKWKYVPPPSL